MPYSNPIMVLRRMVAAYDEEMPKTKKQIDAFIAHWQEEERAEGRKKKRKAANVDLAVKAINHREIETIAETKTFRDGRIMNQHQGRKKLQSVVKLVEVEPGRNVIW